MGAAPKSPWGLPPCPPNRPQITLILLLALCAKGSVAELACREFPFHRILAFDSAAVPQVDLCSLHIGRYDEVNDLTLDRTRQLDLSHQLRRVMTCQLLAVLFERHRWHTGACCGLHTERPNTTHIRSRCLGPQHGSH